MGNSQPGSLGFKKTATSDEIVAGRDLSDKNIAISGTSSGIGLDTARVFYERGAHVYCFNRNLKKVDESHKVFLDNAKKKKDIKEGGRIYNILCDLSSLESIKNSHKIFSKDYPEVKFDFLFANAGVMSMPKGFTVDGFETMMGINHFGNFTWVMGLLPFVKESGRIVITSSKAHTMGNVDFKDMNYYEKSFGTWGAYGQSKIANIYFSRELNRLLKASKKGIIAMALHPGIIRSGLGGHSRSVSLMYGVMSFVGYTKSIQQGSATQVLCALSDKIKEGGGYYDDSDISKSNKLAEDMDLAKQLFKISMLDTGMKYPFKVDGEDVNDLKGVKSSRPKNWVEIVEKAKGIKIKKLEVEVEDEVEDEDEDEDYGEGKGKDEDEDEGKDEDEDKNEDEDEGEGEDD